MRGMPSRRRENPRSPEGSDRGNADARLACAAELHRAGPPPRPLYLLGGDRSLPAELRRHRELDHQRVRSNDGVRWPAP